MGCCTEMHVLALHLPAVRGRCQTTMQAVHMSDAGGGDSVTLIITSLHMSCTHMPVARCYRRGVPQAAEGTLYSSAKPLAVIPEPQNLLQYDVTSKTAAYYVQLAQAIRALGFTHVSANPGSRIAPQVRVPLFHGRQPAIERA